MNNKTIYDMPSAHTISLDEIVLLNLAREGDEIIQQCIDVHERISEISEKVSQLSQQIVCDISIDPPPAFQPPSIDKEEYPRDKEALHRQIEYMYTLIQHAEQYISAMTKNHGIMEAALHSVTKKIEDPIAVLQKELNQLESSISKAEKVIERKMAVLEEKRAISDDILLHTAEDEEQLEELQLNRDTAIQDAMRDLQLEIDEWNTMIKTYNQKESALNALLNAENPVTEEMIMEARSAIQQSFEAEATQKHVALNEEEREKLFADARTKKVQKTIDILKENLNADTSIILGIASATTVAERIAESMGRDMRGKKQRRVPGMQKHSFTFNTDDSKRRVIQKMEEEIEDSGVVNILHDTMGFDEEKMYTIGLDDEELLQMLIAAVKTTQEKYENSLQNNEVPNKPSISKFQSFVKKWASTKIKSDYFKEILKDLEILLENLQKKVS